MPYKNIEDARKNRAKYRSEHPDRIKAYRDKFRINNREKCRKSQNEWRKRKIKAEPWYRLFILICTRCYAKSHHYYKKGIKNYLSPQDLKTMWYRDNADSLRRPSIDRIDKNGDYTMTNARIIEYDENMRRHYKEKK